MTKNIILTGFMGSGKSTIAKVLSKTIAIPLVDTDDLIVKEEGISINEIFEKYGEGHFRNLETDMAKKCSKLNKHIISTGGGIVLKKENTDYLKENGIIFFLEASPETVYNRIKHKTDRPLLKVENPIEKIKELLEKRKEAYNSTYDYKIITDDKDIKEIVDEIIEIYKKNN